jgi:hypothetical protein
MPTSDTPAWKCGSGLQSMNSISAARTSVPMSPRLPSPGIPHAARS